MPRSNQQVSRDIAIDTAIRQVARPKGLPDVPSTFSPEELERLYDVDQELPWQWRLGEHGEDN